VSLPGDPVLDELHYQLGCTADAALIRAASAVRPLFVNGRQVRERQLQTGDLILAGITMFAVGVQPDPPKQPELPVYPVLLSLQKHLFLLLDPGADPRVGPLLAKHSAHYVPLRGQGPTVLLVALADAGTLLAELVDTGWGKGWGIYFAGSAPLAAFQGHFEKFRELEGFRFWDPALVREFLATSVPATVQQFSGPVEEWIIEEGGGFSRVARSKP